jgi:hypothetical protein
VNLSDHLNRSDADVRGVVIKGEVLEVTDEHHNAAIKLQTIQRSKNAKKQVDGIREVLVLLLIIPLSHSLSLFHSLSASLTHIFRSNKKLKLSTLILISRNQHHNLILNNLFTTSSYNSLPQVKWIQKLL